MMIGEFQKAKGVSSLFGPFFEFFADLLIKDVVGAARSFSLARSRAACGPRFGSGFDPGRGGRGSVATSRSASCFRLLSRIVRTLANALRRPSAQGRSSQRQHGCGDEDAGRLQGPGALPSRLPTQIGDELGLFVLRQPPIPRKTVAAARGRSAGRPSPKSGRGTSPARRGRWTCRCPAG